MANPSTCGSCNQRSYVQDSRTQDDYRIRRHECPVCKQRWSTVEIRCEKGNYARMASFMLWISKAPRDRIEALINLVQVWDRN